MKYIIFFLFLFSILVYAQDTKPGLVSGRGGAQKTIWWDVYGTSTADSTGGNGSADGVADDSIIVKAQDTVYAELYIDGLGGADIHSIDFVLQYGYYLIWQPNSYYNNILTLDGVAVDSAALGIDSSGVADSLYNALTKRYMFTYTDSNGTYGVNTDTSLIKFTFTVGTTAGRQILGVPLAEDVGREGYVLRYWAAILNKNNVAYYLTIRNCVIYIQ